MTAYRILFVCLGNICRSPMAEYVLRHHARQAGVELRIAVSSSGTSGWHNGENMHQGTREKLAQHGIDHSGFTSSQVRPGDDEHYDFLIAMDDDNLAELERMFGRRPEKIFKLTDLIPSGGYNHVPDPWYTGDFDETFRLVSEGSRALLKKLGLAE
ncbi:MULTISPECIES: low molecular weight protein-tyrosine-phosphatase [unclassified Neisseria]|uniref:low molecular weight protein-tyrosine-phosphatase n=1 Tax=unclassified Neisseria TaxID=2623750 RepID=UPI002665C92D|nr:MULTISPECIES: low molecular weight protein-tyrosine-phosphatase [unclassified Neisseria]MDO1510426.1 low molecular weight protein-tyrosine-phosphatase [Neisseria sp. MVDL19-042950]MDO1516595.1 low molecular weight protein-tyrosine-phosphatase [Neisseria sp. MVDL18-041461]MDO1563741.1 low molecular weight protein-tyrosine-phosphatase [Neisseria sp. MVDL20-010259]